MRAAYPLLAAALLAGWLLSAGCAPRPTADPALPVAVPGPTGIAGSVTDTSGDPVPGAVVYAYRSSHSQLRGPADFAAEVGADGRYFLDLVEGRYYLVARQRRGGDASGPPRPGDAWAAHPGNPVQVEAERTSRVDFRIRSLARPLSLGRGDLEGAVARLSGRVVDEKGQPVEGAIVMAYRGEDWKRMPDFASPATDANGHFVLPVAAGEAYCLAARTGTRGQPRPGEPFGRYRGADGSACLQVDDEIERDIGRIVLHPYRQ